MIRTHHRLPLLALVAGLAQPALAQSIPNGASGGDGAGAGAPYAAPPEGDAPAGGARGAGPRQRSIEIHPYLEVQQVLDVPISGGGDALTYTDLSAGIDARVVTRTVQAQLDYRYDRQIAWEKGYGSQDVHNGLARADWAVLPGLVTINAAGLATRTRSSLAFGSPDFRTRDRSNTSTVYAGYVGPTLQTNVGALDFTAGYHFGYVHSDTGNGTLVLGPGQPRFDDFTDSWSHTVNASIGAAPGTYLPFGWTISGIWERDTQDFLKARFDDKYVRLDVVQPVSYSLAIVGGVGYEKIEQTQRQLKVDAGGSAILTSDGRLQGDGSKPRQLAYEQDGLIWDVGVSWRPNHRTQLEVRVGRRYGQWIGYGSLEYQLSPTASFQAGVFEQVDTFGHGLTSAIGGLPTAFNTSYNPLVGSLGGCVYGVSGGQGGCLNSALQSVNGNLFRTIGGHALLSATRGPWTYGMGANYVRRKYLTPSSAPGAALLFSDVVEQSATVQANVGRQLSAVSGIDGALYGSWYDSDYALFDSGSSYSAGATATYHRNFTPRLAGQASLGVYGYDGQAIDTQVAGTALVGMRYTF